MYISRLVVSGFKTQTTTPPNPGRNRRIVRLHVPGQGTTERIQMSKFKWVHVHRLTYIKVDKDGNDDGKIYEYTGDHSSFCDGIEDEDLEEIEKEDA
jgi:hypothetical protein